MSTHSLRWGLQNMDAHTPLRVRVTAKSYSSTFKTWNNFSIIRHLLTYLSGWHCVVKSMTLRETAGGNLPCWRDPASLQLGLCCSRKSLSLHFTFTLTQQGGRKDCFTSGFIKQQHSTADIHDADTAALLTRVCKGACVCFCAEWLHPSVHGSSGESPGGGAVPSGEQCQPEYGHWGTACVNESMHFLCLSRAVCGTHHVHVPAPPSVLPSSLCISVFVPFPSHWHDISTFSHLCFSSEPQRVPPPPSLSLSLHEGLGRASLISAAAYVRWWRQSDLGWVTDKVRPPITASPQWLLLLLLLSFTLLSTHATVRHQMNGPTVHTVRDLDNVIPSQTTAAGAVVVEKGLPFKMSTRPHVRYNNIRSLT